MDVKRIVALAFVLLIPIFDALVSQTHLLCENKYTILHVCD